MFHDNHTAYGGVGYHCSLTALNFIYLTCISFSLIDLSPIPSSGGLPLALVADRLQQLATISSSSLALSNIPFLFVAVVRFLAN